MKAALLLLLLALSLGAVVTAPAAVEESTWSGIKGHYHALAVQPAVLQIEADGDWEADLSWKSRGCGDSLAYPTVSGSGDAVIDIDRAQPRAGYFCAAVTRLTGSEVRARIVIPFNPYFLREGSLYVLTGDDTVVSFCEIAESS